MQRSGSVGSMRRGSFGSVRSVGSSGSEYMRNADTDAPYDPVADRAPGNPLFPSNFARLAQPRPPLAHPAPAVKFYPSSSLYNSSSNSSSSLYNNNNNHVRRSSSTRSIPDARGNRFRRSWGAGGGTGGDEYAVTVASGSSAGGSVRDEA
ncbi:hypothetical protein C8R43DRAFT_1046975 [Mycena crocata]|nr:hypothetical protein C8R43DRAFT_1046975 [Mycena crocata]